MLLILRLLLLITITIIIIIQVVLVRVRSSNNVISYNIILYYVILYGIPYFAMLISYSILRPFFILRIVRPRIFESKFTALFN